jgi:hypothetical protein
MHAVNKPNSYSTAFFLLFLHADYYSELLFFDKSLSCSSILLELVTSTSTTKICSTCSLPKEEEIYSKR